MKVRCPRCDSFELVTDEALEKGVLDCSACGECSSIYPESSLKDHRPETRRFQSDVSLEVTDQSWLLVASTRSVTEALPFLIIGPGLGFLPLLLLWFVLSGQVSVKGSHPRVSQR